jgi:hypothetical protein
MFLWRNTKVFLDLPGIASRDDLQASPIGFGKGRKLQ